MSGGAFTLALAQCRRPDNGDVVANVERFVARASQAGADLVVFPEALMTRFDGSVETFRAQAQPADGPFAQAVDALAAKYGIWVVYTINEADLEGGLPYNTAVVADANGEQRATYRKVHLFDAQGHCESDRMSSGKSLMRPVKAPFASIGVGICYDLRFPEVAQRAALSGAQVMLFPAAWVSGPGKVEQWETLLRARAIEDGMFTAGVCCVDEGRIGQSRVYGPDGSLLVGGGDEEELVTCEIDVREIERVRSATPSLEHRRPGCYG